MYALIIGIIIHTRAIYGIQITASEDDRECCRRSPYLHGGTIPIVFVGLQLIREDRNGDRFAACLQPSGVGLPRLFVGRLAIQGSLESVASARAIFVTSRTQVDKFDTCLTSVCAK